MSIQTKNRSTRVLGRRSSLTKMLSEVAEDRVIDTFPRPYSLHITNYLQMDFSKNTKDVCQKYKKCLTGLKICKVIILGDVCVGKTCIVNRFCHKLFESTYKATIGVDFEVEKFQILNIPFNIQIWDTAGQERFKCIAQSYYRSAHVVIVVFDVSSVSTLSNCNKWLREALESSHFQPFVFLVGTKIDKLCDAAYTVIEQYATKVAKTINAEYWPVSSKTGENIDNLFFRIAALAFDDCIVNSYNSVKREIQIGSDLVSFKKIHKKQTKSMKGCTEGKCFK